MIEQNFLRKDYFFSKLIGKREGFPWAIFLILLFVSFLPYLGAAFDGTFYISGEALGLLEHYGNVCFTIVCPLLFLFAMRGIRDFDRFISNIDTNLKVERFQEKVKIQVFLQTNWTKDSYVFVKFFIILFGFVFATWNAMNTFRPEEVWNHDVYDSVNYIGGYITQRVFFYIWWAYILPILIYRLFVIVVTLKRLFNVVIATDSLNLQPMHPDNAGGLGRLGSMALNFNIAILLTMVITASLYYTHGYNEPLACGIFVQFLLLPVIFFLPLLQVHRAMKVKRESLLIEISKYYKCVSDVLVQKIGKAGIESADKYDTIKKEYEEEANLKSLYRSLEAIPTWPFDMRTIIRFFTGLLAALLWLIKVLKEIL